MSEPVHQPHGHGVVLQDRSTPLGRLRCTALAVAGFGLVTLAFVSRDQFLTGDPTYYVGLAVSLAQGDGYSFLGMPHMKYPPGLPVMLAPFMALFGPSVAAAQTLVALFAPAALTAVLTWSWWWCRPLAGGLGLVTALSASVFLLAIAGVRAELPYLAFSVGALAILCGVQRGSVSVPLGLAIAPPLVVGAVALRTIGLALPVAMLAAWSHRRLRHIDRGPVDTLLLAGGGAGMVFAAGWMIWTAQGTEGGYLDLLLMRDPHEPDLGRATAADAPLRIPANLVLQLTHLATLTLNLSWLKPLWTSPLTIGLGVCLGIGLWRELRTRMPVLAWYVFGYGGILLLWPFDEGVRFILPVFPLALALAVRGARVLAQTTFQSGCGSGGPFLALAAALGIGLAALEAQTGGWSRQDYGSIVGWFALGGVGMAIRTQRGRDPRHTLRGLLLVGLVGYSIIGVARISGLAYRSATGSITWPNESMRPGIAWLDRHADSSDVVMTDFASTVHFYTGRRAVRMPRTGDPQVLLAAVDTTGTRYILANDRPEYVYYRPTEEERMATLLRVAPERFTLAHRYPRGTIYRVHPRRTK